MAIKISALPDAGVLDGSETIPVVKSGVTSKVGAGAFRNLQAPFATEAAGRAAVADGQYFKVIGSGDVAAYEYQRVSVGVSTLVATYPSSLAVENLKYAKADRGYGKNIFNINALDVSLGRYVLSTTGAEVVNAGFNATGYMPVVAGQTYCISYKHQIAWYNRDKVFISGSSNSDSSQAQTAPVGAAYLRCSVSVTLTFWQKFQVELGSVPTTFTPYLDNSLAPAELERFKAVSGRSRIASGNYINNQFWSPESFGLAESNTIGAASAEMRALGIETSVTWVMDGLAAGTSAQAAFNQLKDLSPGDPCTGGVTVRTVAGSSAGLAVNILFYTSAGVYVSAVGVAFASDSAVQTIKIPCVVPATATQFKVGLTKPIITTLTLEFAGWFLVKGADQDALNYVNETDRRSIHSSWVGKRLAVLGDSIAFPPDAWHGRVVKELRMNPTIVNLAVPGHTLTYPGSVGNLCDQADSLVAGYVDGDFDLIAINAGTNDFNAQYPLGDVAVEGEAVLGAVAKTNVVGACRYIFQVLSAKFPSARIIFGMPIQRANNVNTIPLRAYVDAIKTMADRCGCPAFDAYAESGIVSYFEVNGGAGRYLSDGLHPSPSGRQRMGEYYVAKIAQLDHKS